MSYLPDQTRLPETKLARTHTPKVGDYTAYRDCCRWEFGFCCALCFLHEADLLENGAEGSGLVWIEHSELKSIEEQKRDVYSNCFLSCRFCNNGRGERPSADPKTGATLLEPTSSVWSKMFVVDADYVMRARDPSDADATYTLVSYGLDQKRKAEGRKSRARRFGWLRAAANNIETNVPKLLDMAKTADDEKKKALLECAEEFMRAYDMAFAEVKRYLATPGDAPVRCRCGDKVKLELPPWLANQLQEVRAPRGER